MANYFTNLSLLMALPSAEAQQYADDLSQQAFSLMMNRVRP